jgi:predicted RNA-binding Zn-ribbon protein involved in translation (DUF1610 family)
VYAAISLLGLAALLAGAVLAPIPAFFLVWQIAFWTSAVAYAVCPRIEFQRLKARLKRAGYRMCLWCGYELVGLPDAHRCPECGTNYDIRRVQAAWKYWIGRRRLPKRAQTPESASGPKAS